MRIDEAILIMENERPHCGDKLTFTEEERYEAYTLALMALRDLQRAYDEGYKQGRYDEKVAAIDALKEHRALYCDNTPDTFSKLSYAEKSRIDELDTAIATLVNLPSAQP